MLLRRPTSSVSLNKPGHVLFRREGIHRQQPPDNKAEFSKCIKNNSNNLGNKLMKKLKGAQKGVAIFVVIDLTEEDSLSKSHAIYVLLVCTEKETDSIEKSGSMVIEPRLPLGL